MGILNLTPDSFSDGGRFSDTNRAVSRALQMEQEGADIIDIGGESTRPYAVPVSQEEELKRVIPVLEALTKKIRIPLSLDTTKSEVARRGLNYGVSIINDVSGLMRDSQMVSVVAASNAGLIIMHARGTPQTMQQHPRYKNFVLQVQAFLERQMNSALLMGISKTRIVIDPGIGFGKTVRHNLTLLNHLSDFKVWGVPVLIGPSRKSFIGKVLSRPYPSAQGNGFISFPSSEDRASDRLEGTAVAVALAISKGVQIVRVHDVAAMVKVSRITQSIFLE